MTFKPCALCKTKYRDEVLSLWAQGVPHKMVFEKYAPLMAYKNDLDHFRRVVNKHSKNHKQYDLIVPTDVQKKLHTIDTIADKFTDLLGKKIENMNPEDVNVRDYAATQKVVIENRKLKLSENAMEIQLSRLFGPPLQGVIEEGVIHGIGPGKDGTGQQTDPQ